MIVLFDYFCLLLFLKSPTGKVTIKYVYMYVILRAFKLNTENKRFDKTSKNACAGYTSNE